MKSPVRRGNKRLTDQPVTVINDTKYVSKISERTSPGRYYRGDYELEQENLSRFLSLYGIICVYIFLIIATIIGGGGIAVCIVYFNSAENTQNWKIGGIVLGAMTCIVAVILMIVTIFKQTRHRPWRYTMRDLLLHPEKYFTDDNDQLSSENSDDDEFQDSITNSNDQIVDTNLSSIPNASIGLLKTVHNDLIYCLNCNHLHPSTQECTNSKRAPNSLSPLENTSDNLVLRRVPIPTTEVIVQQPTTKIMIVRVPNVAGELVIQPKEY